MTDYSVRLAKPHCDNCHKSKEPIEPVVETHEPEVMTVNPVVHISDLRQRFNSLTRTPEVIDDDDI